jgi:hypothetical protein
MWLRRYQGKNCVSLNIEQFSHTRYIFCFRTAEAADALEIGDYVTFGKLMVASHASLRLWKIFFIMYL